MVMKAYVIHEIITKNFHIVKNRKISWQLIGESVLAG